MVEGRSRKRNQDADRAERLERAARDLKEPTDLPLREFARHVAEKHGLPRREVYQMGIQQRREEED